MRAQSLLLLFASVAQPPPPPALALPLVAPPPPLIALRPAPRTQTHPCALAEPSKLKFIVLLREPVARVYSHFVFFKNWNWFERDFFAEFKSEIDYLNQCLPREKESVLARQPLGERDELGAHAQAWGVCCSP